MSMTEMTSALNTGPFFRSGAHCLMFCWLI